MWTRLSLVRASLTHSEIPPDLITSYQTAGYLAVVDTDPITLHINQYSAPLNQILTKFEHQCAVFITASNPLSQQQDPHLNQIRNTQLRNALTQHTDLVFEGVSTDPAKLWPAEQSFLALGINLKTAISLGKQFDQNAVVWADTDAIPRLMLLRWIQFIDPGQLSFHIIAKFFLFPCILNEEALRHPLIFSTPHRIHPLDYRKTEKLLDFGYGRTLSYHGIREHNNIKTEYAGLEAL